MDHTLSDILGKIILLQSTLHVMSNDDSMAKFACRGFSRIPSMESVSIFLNNRFHGENWNESLSENDCHIFFNQLSTEIHAPRTDAHESLIREFEQRSGVHCLTISTGFNLYGFLFVPEETDYLFSKIRPYVENTLNLIALVTENNIQKKMLMSSAQDLEKQINERTRELTDANQTLVDKIIERIRIEEQLKQQEALYHDLVETSQDLIWRCDSEGRYTYLNPAWEKVFGYTLDEMIGRKFTDFQTNDMAKRDKELFARLMEGNSVSGLETIHIGKDGNEIHLVFNAKFITDDTGKTIGTRGTAYDITTRKQAEKERNQLQEQLLQAQKMESIGRLAGGVAHDFNNMIMVILGNAEIALDEIDTTHPVHESLMEILSSAKRSADLTRQLLAFARKQTISPRPLELNELVAGMFKMLERLIGENIELAWKPGSELWNVNMDPTQIEQILVNLSVNARDAVGGVGRVSIETANVHVDLSDFHYLPNIIPGDYVMLTVRDSGRGIDKENLPHLFEPFFTTKEIGQGTGLGLATVHGIISQNQGFIDVDSEPGQGTTFRIYLPRFTGDQRATENIQNKKPARGNETILLVEDEVPILTLGKSILEKYGYTVLAAKNPKTALEMLSTYKHPIHLLITDVIMPGMNGKTLSEIISEKRPGLRTLFMSGYTADVIAHHGVLEKNIRFLEKPFSVRTLAAKTREVLDADE